MNRRSSRAGIVWVAVAALPMGFGCTLLTSFDGLKGPAAGVTDGGAADGRTDGPGNAGSDARDSGMNALTKRTWRQITVSGPPARHSVRMVYDEARKKAVIFGGGGPGVGGDETWEWDGSTWSKATVTTKPPAGKGSGMAYDSAQRATLVYGGSGGASQPMWLWDGATWRNSPGTGPPVLNATGMTYDRARNVTVVFGGVLVPGGVGGLGDVWEWSTSFGWSKRTLASTPPARSANVIVYDTARARTVVFGGDSNLPLGDLWEYDGVAWTQRTPTPGVGPGARVAACGAYDEARGVTVMFGGRETDASVSLDDTWEWDGTTWRAGPKGPPARRACAMAFDSARNAIVMYGGGSRRVGSTAEALGDTWIYE